MSALGGVTKSLQRELDLSRRRFYSWLGRVADEMTVVFDELQAIVHNLNKAIEIEHFKASTEGLCNFESG